MKAVLLLSLLAVSLQAAPAGHRDLAVSDDQSSTDVTSAPSTPPASAPIVSDQPASAPAADGSYDDACGVSTPTTPTTPDPVVSACPVMACMNGAQDCCAQLLTYTKPFGCGLLSGAALACLETEVVNPIVSYLLAGYGDLFVVVAEAGIFGSAAYWAYTNRPQDQDGDDEEDDAAAQAQCMQPARLLGVIAGVLAWYNIHG